MKCRHGRSRLPIVLLLLLPVGLSLAAGAPGKPPPKEPPKDAGKEAVGKDGVAPPAAGSADPQVYRKVLYYVGPAPGYKTPEKAAKSMDGICAGYSAVYKKQIEEMRLFTLIASANTGDALKAEAIKDGAGFILEVYVTSIRETSSKVEWSAAHQMLMLRAGKWDKVFQGLVQQEGNMSFVGSGSISLMLPTLQPSSSPFLLLRDYFARLIPLRKSAGPAKGEPNAPVGKGKHLVAFKATNKLPFPVCRASVVFQKASPPPRSGSGSLFGPSGGETVSYNLDSDLVLDPGKEQEFTIEMSDEDYRKCIDWPSAVTFRVIGRDPKAAAPGGREGAAGGHRGRLK